MTDAEDIDGLAAEYVLGSLDPVERMEVAARRHGEPALDDAIKAWERRLGPLSDAVPPLEPPSHVLRNVMRRIDYRQSKVSAKALPWRRLWPAYAVGASALAACLAAILIWPSEVPAYIPARLMAALEKRVDAADEAKVASVAIGFVVNLDLRASTVVVSPLASGTARVTAGLPALAHNTGNSATDLSGCHRPRGNDRFTVARDLLSR